MTANTHLEVTITHNLPDPAEVKDLFERRLIAIDWGREWSWKSTDPAAYQGRARTDLSLFHDMKALGAAVIAAYKEATPRSSDRVVGLVEPGAEFLIHNGLLCLPLSRARVVDASASFLGNLAPRSCTVQPCGKRARGRLADLIVGKASERSVFALHHRDVEWLVTNWLIQCGVCAAVWAGGQCYETIDHAGYGMDGREVLAQTTISANVVGTKAAKLARLATVGRDLYLFGPSNGRDACPPIIVFQAIETVFAELDATPAGRWLIDRMLASAGI